MIAPITQRIESVEMLRDLAGGESAPAGMKRILVCAGGGCLASGSDQVISALRDEVTRQKLTDQIQVTAVGCMGLCAEGPVLLMVDTMTFYQRVKPEDAAEIINDHIMGGKIIERLVVLDSHSEKAVPCIDDIDFFKRQTKIVLRNCGRVDPESLDDALAVGIYQAAGKVLGNMTAEDVIEQMKGSRPSRAGRGGVPDLDEMGLCEKESGRSALHFMQCG